MMISPTFQVAATFPRTRRVFARVTQIKIVGPVVLLAALFLLKLPYVGLRSIADNGRTPLDGSSAERALFGGLPSEGLQSLLGMPGMLNQFAVWLHVSWFFVPALVTLYVAAFHREKFGSYAGWYLGSMYLAVLVFWIVPVAPPWMADGDVTRILALRWEETRVDANAVAAFPSLHVALPLTLAAWAHSRGLKGLGLILAAYTTAVSVDVVYLGEHYVIDVVAAAAITAAVVAVDSWVRSASRTDFAAPAHRPVPVPAERGQNLIEFAMLMPMIVALIAAIIVFGLAISTRSSLQQAVREGARQAAVGKSLTEVQNLAAGNAADSLVPADIRWCHPVGTTGTKGKVGDPVRVYIHKDGAEGLNYTLVSATGIFNAWNVPSLNVRMSPRATARLERSVSSPVNCP